MPLCLIYRLGPRMQGVGEQEDADKKRKILKKLFPHTLHPAPHTLKPTLHMKGVGASQSWRQESARLF
jgi:hypothetical protein